MDYSTKTTEELQTELVDISIELGRRTGCAPKQALSTTLEYRITDYLNAAYGYTVAAPVTGTQGADALWISNGSQLSVEYKATELVPSARTANGRVYSSPIFSVLDWPAQLTSRDMFVCAMHDDRLAFHAAIVIPTVGVKRMFDHAVSTHGGIPRSVTGIRHKAKFSLKTLITLTSDVGAEFVYQTQVVHIDRFTEVFFGRKDPLYLDLFY